MTEFFNGARMFVVGSSAVQEGTGPQPPRQETPEGSRLFDETIDLLIGKENEYQNQCEPIFPGWLRRSSFFSAENRGERTLPYFGFGERLLIEMHHRPFVYPAEPPNNPAGEFVLNIHAPLVDIFGARETQILIIRKSFQLDEHGVPYGNPFYSLGLGIVRITPEGIVDADQIKSPNDKWVRGFVDLGGRQALLEGLSNNIPFWKPFGALKPS